MYVFIDFQSGTDHALLGNDNVLEKKRMQKIKLYLSAFGKNARHTAPPTICNMTATTPTLPGTPKIVLIASLPQLSIATTFIIVINNKNPAIRWYPAALIHNKSN
uniref:Uncharacterized protein n=1 Tax=Glossina brevipalpis TaxID=37001 RepID=A0A1A9W332_9MUSC